jgi:hypothetical protein
MPLNLSILSADSGNGYRVDNEAEVGFDVQAGLSLAQVTANIVHTKRGILSWLQTLSVQ